MIFKMYYHSVTGQVGTVSGRNGWEATTQGHPPPTWELKVGPAIFLLHPEMSNWLYSNRGNRCGVGSSLVSVWLFCPSLDKSWSMWWVLDYTGAWQLHLHLRGQQLCPRAEGGCGKLSSTFIQDRHQYVMVHVHRKHRKCLGGRVAYQVSCRARATETQRSR